MSKYTSKDGKSSTGESVKDSDVLRKIVAMYESDLPPSEVAMLEQGIQAGKELVQEFLNTTYQTNQSDTELAAGVNRSGYQRIQDLTRMMRMLEKIICVEKIWKEQGKTDRWYPAAYTLEGMEDSETWRLRYKGKGTELISKYNELLEQELNWRGEK